MSGCKDCPPLSPTSSISLPSWEYAESAVEFQLITIQLNCNAFEEEMKLKDSLKSQDFSEIKMRQLKFGSDSSISTKKTVISADTMMKKNSGRCGSIIFVIRRPGCAFCRELALTLRILCKNYPHLLDGFNIFGIIKEIDVDNDGLDEFHRDYFPFPIFLDKSLSFYSAFGSRRVSLINALSLAVPFTKAKERIIKKKIKGNLSGEGFIKGGIIISDSYGKPRYMYEEEAGVDFPIDFLLKALNATRNI